MVADLVIGLVNFEVIVRGLSPGGRGPSEREMFERVAKLVKTDRVRSWRLNQLARSIFLTEFLGLKK